MSKKQFIQALRQGEAQIEGIGSFSVRRSKTPNGFWCKKIHFRCDKEILKELNK